MMKELSQDSFFIYACFTPDCMVRIPAPYSKKE